MNDPIIKFDLSDYHYGIEQLMTCPPEERKGIARVLLGDISRFQGTAAAELRALLLAVVDQPSAMPSPDIRRLFTEFAVTVPLAQVRAVEKALDPSIRARAAGAKGGAKNRGKRKPINAALEFIIEETGLLEPLVDGQWAVLAEKLGRRAKRGGEADDVTDLGRVSKDPMLFDLFIEVEESFGVAVRHKEGLMVLAHRDQSQIIDGKKLSNFYR